jgi:hypothetical protein
MSGHSKGSSGSIDLCENLFTALNQRVPKLIYKKGDNKCSLGIVGARRIFAWVNTHARRGSKIEIWFLGSLNEARKFKALAIRPRTPIDSSWDEYHGRFDIKNTEQLEQAVELLVSVSCPASR